MYRRRTSARHGKSYGMTALELLCATVLASLLMATTLGILAVASKPLSQHATPPRWQRQFLEQLRWDLAHARSLAVEGEIYRLDGYGSLDPDTGAPRHQPCRIAYLLTGSGETRAIVREETMLLPSGGGPPLRTTLCLGANRLELGYPDHRDVSNEQASYPQLHPVRAGRVPEQILVRVYGVHDASRPWFQELLWIR